MHIKSRFSLFPISCFQLALSSSRSSLLQSFHFHHLFCAHQTEYSLGAYFYQNISHLCYKFFTLLAWLLCVKPARTFLQPYPIYLLGQRIMISNA